MSPDKIMKPIARLWENKIYWQQQFTLRENLAFRLHVNLEIPLLIFLH
jgi:hypothetical protein